MARFKVPRREAHITFAEDHDYHGAEIDIYLDQPLAFVFEMQQQFLEASDSKDGSELELMQALLRQFGEHVLASWNLEDDAGSEIPATAEGLFTLPAAFVNTLIGKWLEEATSVPAPLGERSSDGGGSVVPLAQTGSQ